VGEKERDHDLTSLRKEIATLVAEKCVDPTTQRPYPVGMIEKAMAEAGFSVKQNKNAKSQACTSSVARGYLLETYFISKGFRMHQASPD
jgi:ribosome maturation protein SDO1